jgi:hypothetical protein
MFFLRKTTFRKLNVSVLRYEGGSTILLDPLELASITPAFIPEDGNRFIFRNVVFLKKIQTMDEVY